MHTRLVPLAEPLAEAIARSLRAPAAFRRVVATDADGTLWEGDVGDSLFLTAAHRGWLSALGAERLREHAKTWRVADAERASPGKLADELYALAQRGALPIQAQCDLEAEVLGDRPVDELEALCREIAQAYAPSVRPAIRALLGEARAQGLTVCVVSGSLDRLVEATLRAAEIPFDRVYGATLRVRRVDECEGAPGRDWVDVALSQQSPVNHGKPEILSANELGPPCLALGDSSWDVPLLLAAHSALLVHPKPALDEGTRAHPWRRTVHDPAPRALLR